MMTKEQPFFKIGCSLMLSSISAKSHDMYKLNALEMILLKKYIGIGFTIECVDIQVVIGSKRSGNNTSLIEWMDVFFIL